MRNYFWMCLLLIGLYSAITFGMNGENKRRKVKNIDQVLRQLDEAVGQKNIDRAKELIVTNSLQLADIPYDPFLLHTAASNNNLPMLTLLLDQGIAIDSKYYTALHSAITYCSDDAVQYLIERGAAVYADKNLSYHPFVHCAIEHNQGKSDIVRLLLEAGANVQELHENHATPLHHAVKRSYPEITATLLYFGALNNSKNDIGNTPLHIAGLRGNTQITRALLMSPQGGPEVVTDEMRLYQKKVITFILCLKRVPRRKINKDIRKKICSLIPKPEPSLLIEWVPLRKLPYYAKFYNATEKEQLCEALALRHVTILSTIFGRHNRQGFLPYTLAREHDDEQCARRSYLWSGPQAAGFKKSSLVSIKPKIREQYTALLLPSDD